MAKTQQEIDAFRATCQQFLDGVPSARAELAAAHKAVLGLCDGLEYFVRRLDVAMTMKQLGNKPNLVVLWESIVLSLDAHEKAERRVTDEDLDQLIVRIARENAWNNFDIVRALRGEALKGDELRDTADLKFVKRDKKRPRTIRFSQIKLHSDLVLRHLGVVRALAEGNPDPQHIAATMLQQGDKVERRSRG